MTVTTKQLNYAAVVTTLLVGATVSIGAGCVVGFCAWVAKTA